MPDTGQHADCVAPSVGPKPLAGVSEKGPIRRCEDCGWEDYGSDVAPPPSPDDECDNCGGALIDGSSGGTDE